MFIEQAVLVNRHDVPITENELTRSGAGGSTTFPVTVYDTSEVRSMSVYTYIHDMTYNSAAPTITWTLHSRPFKSSHWFFTTTQSFSTSYSYGSSNVTTFRTDFNQNRMNCMEKRFTCSLSCTSADGLDVRFRMDVVGRCY